MDKQSEKPTESDDKEEKSKNWLTAHENTLADLFSISQCMCLCDINGDGENCLVVADLTDHKSKCTQMKLKVYRGISLTKETNIIDLPTGVVSFFLDRNEPRTPGLAVASGPYIYVYKNMKPYFKFTLPSLPVIEPEENIWKRFSEDSVNCEQLKEDLDGLRNAGMTLSVRSIRLLMLSNEKMEEFCNMYKSVPLKKQTVATCLTTLKKSHSEDDAISCLVVGTEAGQLLVIDPEAFTVLYAGIYVLAFKKVTFNAIPVFMCTVGLYDVEFRIYVACRNGNIYVVKRGDTVAKSLIQLNTQPLSMLRVNKYLIVGCMDDTLRCFSPKGRQMWCKTLPATLISMCQLDSGQHGVQGTIVSLGNDTIEIYNNRDLIDRISVSDTVTGLLFGQFGREQFALLMVTRSGSLIIKLLKRTADFSTQTSNKGPPQAQFEKLNIPKKTKLFLDQAFRERENSVAIHRKFMEDLCQLRVTTARSYVEILETKQNPISSRKSDPIILAIEVHGIGPTFKMNVSIKNSSLQTASSDLAILFVYDAKIYAIDDSVIQVPLLVPGVSYPYSVYVECISDKGIADTIKVLVLKNNETDPIVTGVVNMPVSETFIAS